MVEAATFKEGDEVQHRSGGQKMIYVGESQLGEAICEWFDGKKKHTETFSFVALKPYVRPAVVGGKPRSGGFGRR